MTDTDRLDALAAAAHSDTPPHWYTEAFFFAFTDEDDGDVFTPEDAAYLAAVDPATIRALIRDRDAAVRERDELRAALEHVTTHHLGRGFVCKTARAALHSKDVPDPYRVVFRNHDVYGPTPAAALRALAARLSAPEERE